MAPETVTPTRAKEVDDTILWARRMLASDALILDTETTDLHGYICEIGIIRMDGSIVFEALINPQTPILASHIHGITDAMVWSMPTFANVELELRRLLHGRTVVVYNAMYDAGVLEREIQRMCTPSDEQLAWLIDKDFSLGLWEWQRFDAWQRYDDHQYLIRAHAAWWRDRITWECAMLEYSTFVGDWHDYYQNYRFQPLRGGHRAVGDCRAALQVIQRMAKTQMSTESVAEDDSGEA